MMQPPISAAGRAQSSSEGAVMGLLEGKTGIIFGVANKRSIAWAIAQALSREGMQLAFTYQGERLKESVEELTTRMDGSVLLPCDVTADAEIDAVFRSVGEKFGKLRSEERRV